MPLAVAKTAADADKHTCEVYSLCYHNGKLFSCAEDGVVKVWDNDLKLIKEFQPHQSVIYDIAAIDNTLYTCSNDGTVQAWDLESYQNKATLLEGDDEILKLFVEGDQLYAGDEKGNVRLWQNNEMKLIWVLVEEVRGLAVIDKLIFTVRDRDLVVTEKGEKNRYITRKTIEGSSPLCLVGKKVCFVSRSATSIIVMDGSKESGFKELKEFPAHDMIINTLKASGETTLYSGSYDKFIKQWDLHTFTCTGSCDLGECVNSLATGSGGQVYAAVSGGRLVRIDNK